MTASGRRTVVITGASSGIGLGAAKLFARDGWHVIGTGRNPQRSQAAKAAIEAECADGAKLDFFEADLSIMAETERLAETITAAAERIDVLVNNAGGIRDGYYPTPDGNEATFAANHLAPFLLTDRLLPLLRETAAGGDAGAVRIIAMSSSAHRQCKEMRWDDLNMHQDFDAGAAYCQAKLANVLFTRELARRVAEDGIVANAMHPGRVASGFASHGGEQLQAYMASADCDPPEKPAEALFWLATSPEAGEVTGRYFHNFEQEEAAPQAQGDSSARRLWSASEELIEQALVAK